MLSFLHIRAGPARQKLVPVVTSKPGPQRSGCCFPAEDIVE